tara:strand:+ start:56 stop:403 length:348 start_codon:yes stop_codon:yes gene_type:complete
MKVSLIDKLLRRYCKEMLVDSNLLGLEVSENRLVSSDEGDSYFWEIKSRRLDSGVLCQGELGEKEFFAQVFFNVEKKDFDVYGLGERLNLNIREVREEIFHYFSPDLYEASFIKR